MSVEKPTSLTIVSRIKLTTPIQI